MTGRIFRTLWMGMAAWALVGALLSVPRAGHAQANDEEARMHFRLGTAYYDSGRFDAAAKEFQRAYELSKRPQLLYNLFLAHRDAGEIGPAATALRQFLKEVPDVPEREMLEARLASLEKILAERPEAEPTPLEPAPEPAAADSSEPVAETPAPSAAPPEEERLTWLPWTLLGGGAALVATGVTVGFLGVQDEQTLKDDCPRPDRCTLTRAEVDDLKSSGQLKTGVGDALWITGAVTAGVGIAFLFWKPWSHRDNKQSAHVDFACGTSACAARVSGRF